MSARPSLLVVMPSLRISGGNKEVVRLVRELTADGQIEVVIASMWKHSHQVNTGGIRVVYLLDAAPVASRALFQLPAIVVAFLRLYSQVRLYANGRVWLKLGHFVTYLFAAVAPFLPRICFNQDMEWLFVAEGWRRSWLKRAILLTNRKSLVITANAYVTETYRALDIHPFGEASIWAEPRWLTSDLPTTRDIDVLMLLRGSGVKRLDMYWEALKLFRARTALRIAVITPDTEIASRVELESHNIYLRPSDDEMRTLYGRSRVFLLLSDVEGFGLPPLEAMGSGCVPACRDSGGVRCYMRGEFADLLFQPDTPLEQIVDVITQRLQTGNLPKAEAAQRAFAAGLQQSRVNRTECIRRLQEAIAGTRTQPD